MLECVARESGVVNLDVDLEVVLKAVGLQEADNRLRVHVVLVLARLHRLGLDQERALEALRAGVVARHRQEAGKVLLLALLVGVQQAHVAFAAAPEHVVLAPKGDGGVYRSLNLYGCARQNVEVGVSGCAVHVAGVAEHVGRAPKVLDAGGGHLLLKIRHDGVHAGLVLLDGRTFVYKVHVVEAEILDAELLHDFETGVGLGLGTFHGVGRCVPRERLRAAAELVGAFGAKGVPPRHREAEPVLHLLAQYHAFRVVVAVGHRVVARRAFILDLAYLRKIFF